MYKNKENLVVEANVQYTVKILYKYIFLCLGAAKKSSMFIMLFSFL